MELAHITGKGQVVVPARLRRKYGLKRGTKVCFIERDDEIVLRPVTPGFIRSVCGILRGAGSLTRNLLAERAKDCRSEEARFVRRGAR